MFSCNRFLPRLSGSLVINLLHEIAFGHLIDMEPFFIQDSALFLVWIIRAAPFLAYPDEVACSV